MAAFDASFELDGGGVVTAWDSRAERLFGWLTGEIVGRHVRTIVSHRHQEAFLAALESVIKAGIEFVPQQPLPMRVVHRDGHRSNVELIPYPRLRDQGYRLTLLVHDLVEYELLQTLLAARS